MKREPIETSVLIVDDDRTIRELVAYDFESAGFTVHSAEDGTSAFAFLQENVPDAIISDLRMERGGGVELLTNLEKLKLKKRPLFIFISGFSDLMPDEAYDLGAAAFVNKPFGRRVLVDTVQKLLLSPAEKWALNSAIQTPITAQIDYQFKNIKTSRERGFFNLGQGGFFISDTAEGKKNGNPKVGDRMQFRITFSEPTAQTLQGVGIVRWIRSATAPGIGIEFQGLDDGSQKFIQKTLTDYETNSYIPKK